MTAITLRSTKAEIFAALDRANTQLAAFREQVSQLVADNDRLRAENQVLRNDAEAADDFDTQVAVREGRDNVEAEPMAPLALTQRDYAPETKARLKAYAGVVAAHTKCATRVDWARGVVQYYVKSAKEWRDAK